MNTCRKTKNTSCRKVGPFFLPPPLPPAAVQRNTVLSSWHSGLREIRSESCGRREEGRISNKHQSAIPFKMSFHDLTPTMSKAERRRNKRKKWTDDGEQKGEDPAAKRQAKDDSEDELPKSPIKPPRKTNCKMCGVRSVHVKYLGTGKGTGSRGGEGGSKDKETKRGRGKGRGKEKGKGKGKGNLGKGSMKTHDCSVCLYIAEKENLIPCRVCCRIYSTKKNPLILCESCNKGVHQKCLTYPVDIDR